MKDSEFIELLNLYLDHEITSADAVRLESEVQSNPARRRVYQQYCRMQKACKMFTSEFHSEATSGVETIDRKVVAFETGTGQRRPRHGVYVASAAALAAAACITLIFAGLNRSNVSAGSDAPPNQFAAKVSPLPVTNTATSQVASEPIRVTPVSSGLVQRPMLVNDPLFLVNKGNTDGEFASAVQANDQLAWISALQLAPLQQRVPIEDLRFDARPVSLRPEARVLGGGRVPAEAPTEMTAFRFIK